MNDNPSANPQAAAREAELFRAALQREAGPARAAFLDEACAGDRALRERLEALVQAHESPAPFLEPIVEGGRPKTVRSELAPEERPGARIGRYKLLQVIGEG